MSLDTATALAPLSDPRAPHRAPSRPRPDERDHRGPAHRPGRHLRPVERPTRRRSPAVPALVGVGIVIAALLALAAMHAVLIGGQLRLDEMRREVAAESESIRRLQLQVAELESPDRMLDTARSRLGMVEPEEVGYLAPLGVDVGDEGPVRVEAATTPPPAVEDAEEPVEEPVGSTSTDDTSEDGDEGGSDVAELAEGARDE